MRTGPHNSITSKRCGHKSWVSCLAINVLNIARVCYFLHSGVWVKGIDSWRFSFFCCIWKKMRSDVQILENLKKQQGKRECWLGRTLLSAPRCANVVYRNVFGVLIQSTSSRFCALDREIKIKDKIDKKQKKISNANWILTTFMRLVCDDGRVKKFKNLSLLQLAIWIQKNLTFPWKQQSGEKITGYTVRAQKPG